MGKKIVIAVDFDGVVVENKYPEIGNYNREIIEWICFLQRMGNTIILYTCRSGEDLRKAVLACQEIGFHPDYVNENALELIDLYGADCRKISAHVYIDDRHLGFDINKVVPQLTQLVEDLQRED